MLILSNIAMIDVVFGAKKEQFVDILVLDCICGNHVGRFDARYKSRLVEVSLMYGGKTKFYKNGKMIKEGDWQNILLHDQYIKEDGGHPMIIGKHVIVKGIWEDTSNFDADCVYLK